MKIISASIDLAKIDKTRIVEGKTGAKYYNLDIIVNDEKNQYGQDVSISTGQTKEERERKDKKVYIGNGKTVWESKPNVPAPEKSEPYSDPLSSPSNYKDDLPF